MTLAGKLVAFVTRSPPVVLTQLTLFVYAIGLLALSFHLKKGPVSDFHSDKTWSGVYGKLATSQICAGVAELAIPPSADVVNGYGHVTIKHGVCVPPSNRTAGVTTSSTTVAAVASTTVAAGNETTSGGTAGSKRRRSLSGSDSAALVHQIAGDTAVHQIAGDTAVHQIAGATTVHQIAGDTTVHQIAGDTAVHRIAGDAAVHQIAGDTAVHQIAGDTAAAIDKSGSDIDIDGVDRQKRTAATSTSKNTGAKSSTTSTSADDGSVSKTKIAKTKRVKHRRFFHRMTLLWRVEPWQACDWQASSGNMSRDVTISGTVCGQQLDIPGGNTSRVSFTGKIASSKLYCCCSKRRQTRSATSKKGDKDCCSLSLEDTCVSLWMPADKAPSLARNPGSCPKFKEPLTWLPVFAKESQQQCANSTALLTPRDRKFHQNWFLFDIQLNKTERAAAADSVSTVAASVLMVSVAIMAALVYHAKPEKRIVAVADIKG